MDETIPDLRFIELAQYVSPFWLIVSLQLDSLIGNIKVELFAKLAFSQISYIHFGTRVNESGFKIVVCFNAAQFSASQSIGEDYREFMQRFCPFTSDKKMSNASRSKHSDGGMSSFSSRKTVIVYLNANIYINNILS